MVRSRAVAAEDGVLPRGELEEMDGAVAPVLLRPQQCVHARGRIERRAAHSRATPRAHKWPRGRRRAERLYLELQLWGEICRGAASGSAIN